MKVHVVIFLWALLATTFAAPADTKEDKEPTPNKEVDLIPPKGSDGFPGGVVDIDAGGDGFFGNPFIGNPFPSLLGSIEALMARMRQQLNQILGRLPDKPGETGFPELHIPNLGDIDLGKGNTTSVTKVIDGHKVVINETQYQKADENGGAFFKVRIIDVHPDSSEENSTEKDAEAVHPPRDRESVESFNNEIPKPKDNEALNADNIETFDVDSPLAQKTTHNRRDIDWNDVRSVESIEDNSIDAVPPLVPQFHDLSNDIYVNELLAKEGAPRNPDAEIFDTIDNRRSGNVPPNMPIRYGFPQPARYHNTFPMSDFEQLALQHGVRPIFAPMPMPYYSHPMFPQNRGYNIPIQRSSPDAVSVNSEKISSYLEKQTYRPASQEMKIQVISNEIPQTEMKREVASSSSAPQEAVNTSTTK